jgi:hypothetical protein
MKVPYIPTSGPTNSVICIIHGGLKPKVFDGSGTRGFGGLAGVQVSDEPFWQIFITNIYKYQTLLGWQNAESHECKVFNCTSGTDRQSLHTSCGKYSHS